MYFQSRAEFEGLNATAEKKTHIEKQRKCNNKLQHAKMNPCYYHNRSSIFLNEIITFSTE